MPLTVAVLDANGTPVTVLTLDAIAAILGEITASPTANTLLDRLKTIATLLAAATPAGANIIGAVKTDQTTHGTTDLVAADITKVAGAAIQQGHGVAAAAIRVELPTDSTGVVARITNGGLSGSAETSTVYNGTTALVPKYAKISADLSGANTLVAAVVSKKIRVLAYNFIGAGAVGAKFRSATSADLTGLKTIDAAGGGICANFNPVGWFETVSDELLNLDLSGAVLVGGELVYVEV